MDATQSPPRLVGVSAQSALPAEVLDGEARLFDLLYARVASGDAAVSAAVVKTIEPTGPMQALWIMANVNVTRRRQRLNFFLAPFRLFRRPDPDLASDDALQALADAVRKRMGEPERHDVRAA